MSGTFFVCTCGVFGLLAFLAPYLGITRPKENPGDSSPCHSLGLAVPSWSISFSPPFRVVLCLLYVQCAGLFDALSRGGGGRRGVGRGVSTVPSQGTGVCLVFIELLATENWFVVTCSGPFWFFMCITGGDLSPLELADVNGDGLRDVLLSFVMSRNGSAVGKRRVFSRLLQGYHQLGENIRAVSQVVLQKDLQ